MKSNKPYLALLCCLILCTIGSIRSSYAQDVICSRLDSLAFQQKMLEIKELTSKTSSNGALMTTIGKSFLTTPYVAKTLELGPTESLVINLQGLDCTTFVENVLALALMTRDNTTSLDEYVKKLEQIRYRNGQLNGYASRLHYFTEWVADNAAKGLVVDVTQSCGGIPLSKNIDFMGTHRDSYPFLKDDKNYRDILAVEADLKQHQFFYIPQEQIAKRESLLQSGDIVALTTSIPGLDVTHTGILTRESDGRIHLLHASTGSMEVEISEKPLAEYLKQVKSNTGILVARPNF